MRVLLVEDEAKLARLIARGLTERLKKENPKVNGDWRIGCGIVMGWHTQAAGILEPHLVEHWQGFAEAKPYWAVS